MTIQISFEDVTDNFRRITITGRLDIQGAGEIEVKFATLSATADRRIVVDLTGVSFLASVGIRILVVNAKAVQQRGGRMVLFVGDNEMVAKTLKTTGIDMLIPMYPDAAEADQAAQA